MTFKRENITVTIRRKSFDKSKYKIKKDENGYVAAINGKHVQVVEEGQWGCPQIYISADKKCIYIFSAHSDAAGAYEVTWVIQDKKYLRRVVDGGY